MKGSMHFRKDGFVKIEAFGRPGCTFSNDTINNELRWTIQNDSLLLYNPKDQFSLAYVIQNATKDEMVLRLMDDIFLTLHR